MSGSFIPEGRAKRERSVVSYLEPRESDIFREPPDTPGAPPPPKRAKREKEPAEAVDEGEKERRRSGRVVVKEEAIDAVVCVSTEVTGAPELRYAIGGADLGGQEARSILGEVETDEGLLQLTSQFRSCRRVLLWQRGKMVAAAIIELHAREKVLEIPILATRKDLRQQGFGSVMLGLLMEVARRGLDAVHVVVSATKEARRFWLRQGFHTSSQCSPVVAAAMRALSQKSGRFGFFKTTLMARQLPAEAAIPGALVSQALARQKERWAPASKGFAAEKAAEKAGYEEVRCSFTQTASGRADLVFTPEEQRGVEVRYERLQAFIKPAEAEGPERWGVRCTSHIKEGAVVLELCGQWLDDLQYESLPAEEREKLVSFDESTRQRKREHGDPCIWLDMRHAANLGRLVSECNEAANLELSAWPPAGGALLPRRLFLVAKHEIAASTELAPPLFGRRAAAAAAAAAVVTPAKPPPLAVGSVVEVEQAELALCGARYSAVVLRTINEGKDKRWEVRRLLPLASHASSCRHPHPLTNHSRFVAHPRCTSGPVKFFSLYEPSPSTLLLTETLALAHLRPPPPPPPDGFHRTLLPGDCVELRLEDGWWPAQLVAANGNDFQVCSSINRSVFAAVSCTVQPARLRPAWKWAGLEAGGGWSFSTKLNGVVNLDATGRCVRRARGLVPMSGV
ncbi:hypothetical protein AB1Y20_022227 [Prymnesium parvum]|uniref:N-acetyltransferase domain-containing protein n=1 Tax=Prymnesium parvum TaxID=97485 RepID=A0AB34JGA4_PRYPA